jgi:hypothetical protein
LDSPIPDLGCDPRHRANSRLFAIKGRHVRCNPAARRTLATIYFEHGDDVITLDSVENALTEMPE